MQETRNNATANEKQRTLLLHFGTRAYLFSPDEGDHAIFFQPETIVVSFLHLMVLFFKVIFNHTSKRQSLVLLFQ